MSKKNNPTLSDFAKLGFIEKDGVLVKSEKLVVNGKVEKITHTEIRSDLVSTSVIIPNSENKKVRNATKIEAYGLKFDSLLEKYMYDLLRWANIEFEFQKVYLLQDRFRYRDEAVRSITCRVDFWLPVHNLIIDAKGYSNDVSPLKYKMLKSYLKHIEDSMPEIIMPKNKKECDLLLNRILYDV